MERERIIAVGLLTEGDLAKLGTSFARAYLIDETPCFGELLAAIDDADRGRSQHRESVTEQSARHRDLA